MALGANAKIELIKRTPLFEHCSKKDLQLIAQIADELDLKAGKVLMEEGERGREFFVIVSGERRGATERPSSRRSGRATSSARWRCSPRRPAARLSPPLTPLDVLVITDRAFLALLDKMPDLWHKVARALAERLGDDELGNPR